MPYRKQQFANGEIYHIVIRAIDDNSIFKNINDYYRGIFSIYEFNNVSPITIQSRRRIRVTMKKSFRKDRERAAIADVRDKIVEIFAFTFMSNHIHLLIRQIKDGGITKFMRKLGAGYGGYFNRKYNRKGYVFQNRFLAKIIKNDDQLRVVFTYIHTNPVALIEPGWKEKGVKNPKKVIRFLESYKWSSYQDFIGKKNFPSVTDRDFISGMIDDEKGCKKLVNSWINHKGKIKRFLDLQLE